MCADPSAMDEGAITDSTELAFYPQQRPESEARTSSDMEDDEMGWGASLKPGYFILKGMPGEFR